MRKIYISIILSTLLLMGFVYPDQPALPQGCILAGTVERPDSVFLVVGSPDVRICAIGIFSGTLHLFTPPTPGNEHYSLEWFGDQFVRVNTGGRDVDVLIYKTFHNVIFLPMNVK